MTSEQRSPLESLSFGRAQGKDFVGIAALDRAAWSDGHHPERIPDGEHVWRVWVAGAYVHVARDGAQVVGAIVAFPTRQGILFVHKVMVDKRRQGCGIGTKLFALLLEDIDANVHAACFLTVDPANDAAVKRYARIGFTEREYVAGYYRDDEDRYVLTRPAVGVEPGPGAASDTAGREGT
jgi:ribosomal protein S18 acetylase RimI-like enzyme